MTDKQPTIEDRVREIPGALYDLIEAALKIVAVVDASSQMQADGIQMCVDTTAIALTTLINDLITQEAVRQSKKRGKLRKYYSDLLAQSKREIDQAEQRGRKEERDKANLLEGVITFARKIATVMDELASSQVYFILGQAYENILWSEAQEMLTDIIQRAKDWQSLKEANDE